MYRIDQRMVLSATDLTAHVACAHSTTLDLLAVDAGVSMPVVSDSELDLILAMGVTHERAYLERLRGQGLSIVELPAARDRRAAERLTLEAMRSGVDVIYQATFFDGEWSGRPDFLLRTDFPSGLGLWSYEVADTKLARGLHVPALLQLAVYAERLSALQGVAPATVWVITGDGLRHPWRLADVAAYARRLRARLTGFLAVRPTTEAVPVAHCAQCRWRTTCAETWLRADDLSQVAAMRGDHREALRAQGISTMAALAEMSAAELPKTIGRASREGLVQQAALQVHERRTGEPSFLLLPPAERAGLLRLPPADPGDLYLDFEGDPYADGGAGREYLAGVGDRSGEFTSLWAHTSREEARLTADLVDLLTERWRAHPGMHVYHYAPYEKTALKRLTARHGVREFELDQLLRGQRLVDLYAVVRQGLRISKPSYSIKKLEAFYWRTERPHPPTDAGVDAGVTDGMASVIAYERWLVDRDRNTLPRIEAYNRDDVRSTQDLHSWLEERRVELEAAHGVLPRPTPSAEDPDKPISDAEHAEIELAEQLSSVGEQLLADLVRWHRREARPAWSEFFRLADLDEDEILDDGTALGPLSPPELVGTVKKSNLWRYTFDPQDTVIRVGDPVIDVADQQPAGTVVELDVPSGFVIVKRTTKSPAKVSLAFGPRGPIGDDSLRAAIAAAGTDLLAGRRSLQHALLTRAVPDTELLPGESPDVAVVRIGCGLGGTVLAVQGPPGSGKSTVGARLIRALLDDGKTVGVVALSHAVIGNLLNKVGRPALQKCSADQHCGSDQVGQTADNADVADALGSGTTRLVGGTAWLFAAPEMVGAVDVLIVEEAGQFSLANAVAVARGARSLVLLGDPQQLQQPTQGLHPNGAGASVLEHLLDGHHTVPADRGVFLDRSWRMHPKITSFISELAYDGRLTSAPGRERQEVIGDGILSGNGIRMVPVRHTGRAAKSPEEAAVIHDLWHSLQGLVHVRSDGTAGTIGPDDVLIVAPYNNQVGEIARLLPAARVGTVDKFQGQQAPVVLYSMTSSTAADAPRGVGFLYDTHRLNVAVSRAQALAVVVLNPVLLDAPVNDPEQLRRVNALCRLAECAEMEAATQGPDAPVLAVAGT